MIQVFDPLSTPELAAPSRKGWQPPVVRTLDNFLSAAECEALRARITAMAPAPAPITTARGAVLRPDIRNNERVIFDDLDLAADLFARARPYLPERLRGEPRTTQTEGPLWQILGLNERFRGYRYRLGHYFAPHYDGCFARSPTEQSALTFMIYLDENCAGGETNLLDWGVTVRPQEGRCLIFDHYLLHEGAAVIHGEKHVLRSDVMYRQR